jgi:hypothetical protein
MQKRKRLAEEERRFHAARTAKRRKNPSAGKVLVLPAMTRAPAGGDGRRKTTEEWEPPAVLPENFGKRLQELVNAYRLNTKG